MIFWKDEYRIGIEEIDEQHKKLFDLAGEIYDLLKTDKEVDKYDQIIQVIQELKDYSLFHFSEEEEYMRSINYPRFFSHKVLHAEFIDKVNTVNITILDNDQTKYLLEILDFVVIWLQDHILKVDQQYHNKNS